VIFFQFSSFHFVVVVWLRRGVRKRIRHECTEQGWSSTVVKVILEHREKFVFQPKVRWDKH